MRMAALGRGRARSLPDTFALGKIRLDYRTLLPERFEVDIEKRYVLDKLVLGEGGYGKVFVARDGQFENRLVAVKKLTKTKDVKRTEAYHEEMRIMKELDHPNICKLFETFEQGRHMFFIMEYCEGGEVFDKILANGFISEKVTHEIVAQVGAALRYAHGRNIAHRDIKPENLVFCTKEPDDYRVKVIDWGLSISFSGQQMTTAVGSFAYAAPEVIMSKNHKAYTCACDLWSLGVVSYVMLCGKPPFWGAPKSHLQNARAEKYPMASAPWDMISGQAKDFIKQLLKADPEQRLTSEQVFSHKWITDTTEYPSAECTEKVMQNLHRFRDQTFFMQLCITAVARQLDHNHLKDIHQVFREMDANGDGTLSFEEIGNGLRRIFGESSEECQHLEETFASLDLDGSGAIDYTEFCAAGLGASEATKADVVWAAFKAFDLDDNGALSKEEIGKVLGSADVQKAWSAEVCSEAAEDIMARFDKDGDGQIEFEEWMQAMHASWKRRHPGSPGGDELEELQELLGGISIGAGRHLVDAYSALAQVNALPPHSEAAAGGDGGGP